MPLRLRSTDPDFAARFRELVERRREEQAELRDAVAAIIAEVRERGDAGLLACTERFDRLGLTADRLRVTEAEVAAARRSCDAAVLEALEFAAARIRAFHERQLPGDFEEVDALGVRMGLRWRPIDAVGLYVPGGTAAYPSSVLMNAIPAKVAGCRRLVMTVPSPEGRLAPLVLAAAEIAGIDEIYRIGGAQAIAALAHGTETISPVDKVVGPGNAYVAEAKRQLFGRIGIDMIAGPSEVVVVADGAQRADWLAADLLSQAEHDPRAQAILITEDAGLADRVEAAVETQLATLKRAETARASWQREGAIILVEDPGAVPELVDALAPEHLELMVEDPEPLLQRVRNAGAIFLGPWTAEVIGDYVGGPNHVLPTGRTARFASGLGVHDFMKRTTILGCDRAAFARLAGPAARLARAEGLEAHARAIEIRLDDRR